MTSLYKSGILNLFGVTDLSGNPVKSMDLSQNSVYKCIKLNRKDSKESNYIYFYLYFYIFTAYYIYNIFKNVCSSNV
jgi:hypothetical protein